MLTKAKLIAVLAAITTLAALGTGCFQKQGAASSSVPSSAKVSSAEKQTNDLAAFRPLKDTAGATLYEDFTDTYTAGKVTQKYDLDGDGKLDSISLQYQSAPDTGKDSVLTVNGTQTTLSLVGLGGVYVVDLDSNDKEEELAIVSYGMDNDVGTTFYRYRSDSLKNLGTVPGGIALDKREGYFFKQYDSQIESDGKGHLIPRFGIMEYVTPNILLEEYELKSDKISAMKLDLSDVKGKEYTISTDIKPFFQAGDSNVKTTELSYDDAVQRKFKKGTVIKLLDVAPSLANGKCAYVELSDKTKGLLYFFLVP